MNAVHISRPDLVGAFTAALAFAGSDTSLPSICGIQLSIHKNRLVLASTDRFKAALIRVEIEAAEKLPDRKLGFIETASARKALAYIKMTGQLRKAPVVVEFGESDISFAAGEGSRFTHTLNAAAAADDGPDIHSLIQKHIAYEAGPAEWSANPDYIAAFRIAKRRSGDRISVRSTVNHRGIVATVGDHFLGLLMPVRETTPLSERLDEWQQYLKPSPKPRAARKATARQPASANRATAKKPASRGKKAAA